MLTLLARSWSSSREVRPADSLRDGFAFVPSPRAAQLDGGWMTTLLHRFVMGLVGIDETTGDRFAFGVRNWRRHRCRRARGRGVAVAEARTARLSEPVKEEVERLSG